MHSICRLTANMQQRDIQHIMFAHYNHIISFIRNNIFIDILNETWRRWCLTDHADAWTHFVRGTFARTQDRKRAYHKSSSAIILQYNWPIMLEWNQSIYLCIYDGINAGRNMRYVVYDRINLPSCIWIFYCSNDACVMR